MTGATGFLGAWVAARLCQEGHEVRVTYRTSSRLAALDGYEVEPVRADILDRRAMRRALRGVSALFHVAGKVGAHPAREVYEVNARGAEVAVEAAAAAGVERVVLTSSVAGVGPSRPGEVADEEQTYWAGHLGLNYVNAKHEAEALAMGAAARGGVDLVIVQPSYVLGPGVRRDEPPVTSNRMIANYLLGRIPAIVDTWNNMVDVEDVAEGHLLAWRRGRAGERYILGGHNVRWSEVLARVARLAGVERPYLAIPPEVEPIARLGIALNLPTPISLQALILMSEDFRFSSAKAKRELGYRVRGLDATLRRTVEWCMELIEDGRVSDRPDFLSLATRLVRGLDRVGLHQPAQRAIRAAIRQVGG